MRDIKSRYGEWGVIVGAAKGIGASFAHQLAGQGVHLILVDHDEDVLHQLTETLKTTYPVKITALIIDLSHPDSHLRILEEIKSVQCRLLIYNAAFSIIKKFSATTSAELESFLQVNVSNQLKLVHGFVQHLKSKKETGGILLMSSLAGLLGMQLVATYAATKAFAWNLAEALHHELKPDGIDVSACIAGATLSETYINTKPEYGAIKPQLQTPDEVAKTALRKLGTRAMYITGFSNRLNYYLLTRILPRKMAARIANQVIAKMYRYAEK